MILSRCLVTKVSILLEFIAVASLEPIFTLSVLSRPGINFFSPGT